MNFYVGYKIEKVYFVYKNLLSSHILLNNFVEMLYLLLRNNIMKAHTCLLLLVYIQYYQFIK